MAYSEVIAGAVAQYLTEDIGDYIFDAAEGVFDVNIELETRLKRAKVLIVTGESDFICYTVLHFDVPEERLTAMAEYTTRVNHGLPNGNFELDFETGILDYKIYVSCYSVPERQTVLDCFDASCAVLLRFGDGLLDVVEGIPPEEVYMKVSGIGTPRETELRGERR